LIQSPDFFTFEQRSRYKLALARILFEKLNEEANFGRFNSNRRDKIVVKFMKIFYFLHFSIFFFHFFLILSNFFLNFFLAPKLFPNSFHLSRPVPPQRDSPIVMSNTFKRPITSSQPHDFLCSFHFFHNMSVFL